MKMKTKVMNFIPSKCHILNVFRGLDPDLLVLIFNQLFEWVIGPNNNIDTVLALWN